MECLPYIIYRSRRPSEHSHLGHNIIAISKIDIFTGLISTTTKTKTSKPTTCAQVLPNFFLLKTPSTLFSLFPKSKVRFIYFQFTELKAFERVNMHPLKSVTSHHPSPRTPPNIPQDTTVVLHPQDGMPNNHSTSPPTLQTCLD